MYNQAFKAYENAQKTAIGTRELERMALARTTYELTNVRDNFTPGRRGYDKYAHALKFNQKLWTLIQSNIAENPTSGTESLRTNLLRLSLFVDRQTMTALRDPNPDNLKPLIEINKNISGGLYASSSRSEPVVAQHQPQLPSFVK